MEIKNEEEECESTGDNTSPVKTPTTLDKYQIENQRREEILEKETALQERKEKLHTEQMLGGSSAAGQTPEEKKEMSDKEYAEKITAGEIPDVKA